MKNLRFLRVIAFAGAVMAAPLFAADAPSESKPARCCAKAQAEGKACTHECCAAAQKDGKACEKCGGTNAKKS